MAQRLDRETVKRRPVIFVSNDSANRNLSRVVVIPVTSSIARVFPSEALVKVGSQTSKAMTDQIMAADKSVLKNQIGALSKADLELVDHAIRVHVGLAI